MAGVDVHQQWVDHVVTQYGQVIRDRFDPATQPAMSSNARAWRRWNPGDHDVAWALDQYGRGVHRTDLAALARDLDTVADRRRAFVVTLLWGVGTTNWYYGRHAQALASPDLDAMLDRSAGAIRRGDLADGWSAIYRLPGLARIFRGMLTVGVCR